MNDIVLNLVVIAVVAILVVALFIFLQQRKRQKEKQFQQMGKEKGWQVELVKRPLISGYQLKGKDAGSQWTLETLAESSSREAGPGSSEVRHHTRWWTDEITLAGNDIVIGPGTNPEAVKVLNSFGSGFLQKALQVMLGNNAQWAANLSPIEVGTSQLQKNFLVLAAHEDNFDQLFSPEVEKALLTLSESHKAVITLRESGLEIRLPEEQVLDRATLEQIINLGKTIALALRSPQLNGFDQ